MSDKRKTKIIYIARFPNGKCYVGQCFAPIKKRIRHHKKSANCRALYNAIKKYGAENIKWEVLDIVEVSRANAAERFYIFIYNAFYDDGYNLTTGGGCNTVLSVETRNLMSKRRKGRKTGVRLTGKKNGMFGKKHTKETREKMSQNRKGKATGEMNAMYKNGQLVSGEKNGNYGKPTWNKGKKLSKKIRMNMSRAQINRNAKTA